MYAHFFNYLVDNFRLYLNRHCDGILMGKKTARLDGNTIRIAQAKYVATVPAGKIRWLRQRLATGVSQIAARAIATIETAFQSEAFF